MPKDCVILVADLDTENAIKGLLSRPVSIGCRNFSFDIYRHPRRDPGVRRESAAFLSPFLSSHNHALLVLDRHGCGLDRKAAIEIEAEIANGLSSGWAGRSSVIVIDPELETWVWSDSPIVDKILGWHGRIPTLRDWLVQRGLRTPISEKPTDPKQAFNAAILHVQKTRSASIFESLGREVSTRRCSDRAFLKLRAVLALWFPTSSNP